ncbi:MAG: EamA family transporter [Melioribacteraceae bacterium]|nr:EamA family transporter [Melioribacteraceae bacterium]
MSAENNFKAYLAYSAICVVWGTTYLAIRIGVSDLPPMLFAGFRWLLAGPLLAIFLLFNKYSLPKMEELKYIAIIGIALLGVTNGLVVVAEQWLPSGLTALLISTLPIWVVIIESLVFGIKRVNITTIIGIVLGTTGIVTIFLDDFKYVYNIKNLIGIACIMIAMISWAAGSLYSKQINLNVRPLMSASIQMIFAGLFQTLLGLGTGELSSFTFTENSLFAFLYLAIVASVLGYGSYIYAISKLPVSFVTTYAYVNPVIALLLGWLILNETLNNALITGAIIILAGVWLVQKGSIRSQASA